MFTIPLLIVLATSKKPLSTADRAFLAHIDRAVGKMSDKKAAFVAFEKRISRSDAMRCKELLPAIAPNSNEFANTAFVQAYYGVDYEANLKRLLRPYRYYIGPEARWRKEYPNEDGGGENLKDMDGLYQGLNWLYLTHHDLTSLGYWEDLRLDGGPAEGNDDELYQLWQRHAPDMLKAALGHPQRIGNLLEAFLFNYADESNGHAAREVRLMLLPYFHAKDIHVRTAAREMSKALRSGKYSG